MKIAWWIFPVRSWPNPPFGTNQQLFTSDFHGFSMINNAFWGTPMT
jgi:hypothetical protein